jgi:EAL domain-containing protein (putative c-di-GMP-specific phosphodiesterase class I)
MGSTFAILTVTTRDHTGQALATLVDLGPQISALLHQAVSTEVATSRDRGEIEVALAPGGLRAVFQPIVALPHVAVVGFEGLSRFHDGCRPDRRFNHARRIGLGAALERRAIEEVMAAATRLPSDVWVSVNVSAETLLSTDLADLLRQRDRRVRLEITEHEQVGDYAAVMDAVARLDGVELGVDDAGAGYASLRHVYELRPTMVKLDRAWVAGIDGDPMRRALLIGLQHFVNEFGAELLGEGVERAEDSATLSQLGVPLAQGYLYGRPAPPEEWT